MRSNSRRRSAGRRSAHRPNNAWGNIIMHTYKLVLVFVVALAGSISAADWPQWRGPRGNGASDEKNLPVKWSATENVAWKAADRRPRRLVADRLGRSRLRHVADRHRRPPARQSSAARAGRERRHRRRTRARGGRRRAGRRPHLLRRRGVQPRRRPAPVAVPDRSVRTAAGRARQAQPREPEPGDRRPDGVRLVRHRADRRARHERQGRLGAASRQGDRAVRHQLGPLAARRRSSATR